MPTNYKQLYAIQKKNEQKIKEVCPSANEDSGIYMFFRTDEDGIRFGYVGQARHLSQRLAQHLSGYEQHIDRSIKSHGLFSNDKPHGWKVYVLEKCPQSQLDDREEYWIVDCAKKGIQLHNKTRGRQGEGKEKINEYKPSKGYRDGIQQGKKSLAKELRNIIDKHLIVDLKPEKANNKVSIKAFEKFKELVYGDI